MSKIVPIFALILVAVGGWMIGSILSPDALGMALGVLLGLMASIPAALIAVSARPVQPPTQSPVPVRAVENPAPIAALPSSLNQLPAVQQEIVVVLPKREIEEWRSR